jgi:hypothetical protein
MCREIVNGGRRCPCSRGDRRRAYQRMRYAVRQTTPLSPAGDLHTDSTHDPEAAPTLTDLRQRRAATTAAVNEALIALRDPDRSADPDVHEAYLNAVLEHGAVVRDIANHHIEQTYAERGLDDASVTAEAAVVVQRLEEVEADWREAKKRTDSYLTPDGKSFVSEEAAVAIDTARNDYAARKKAVYRDALERSTEINAERVRIAREEYYTALVNERNFGGAEFTPSNAAKMTKSDHAMFTTITALYPDEMVEHAASLGPMLAKRSKARAHYTSAAWQRTRRTQSEVFDLNDALQHGRFRFTNYVDSTEEMARGGGSRCDRFGAAAAFVPRTADNERRVRELVAQYNAGRRQPATIEYATAVPDGGGEPHEVMYVKGARKRTKTEVTGLCAEVRFSDSESMAHEMGHRMEDRNPEISAATKAFLRRRTAGLPFQRYHERELVVEDSFGHAYFGKDYPGGHHTELFSCGMEAVTHGCFGGLRGQSKVSLPAPGGVSLTDRAQPPRADPEHLALVLGLLASANKRIA